MKTDRVYLVHIVDAIARIESYWEITQDELPVLKGQIHVILELPDGG